MKALTEIINKRGKELQTSYRTLFEVFGRKSGQILTGFLHGCKDAWLSSRSNEVTAKPNIDRKRWRIVSYFEYIELSSCFESQDGH